MSDSNINMIRSIEQVRELLGKLSGENGTVWLGALEMFLQTKPGLSFAKLKELEVVLWRKCSVGGLTYKECFDKVEKLGMKISDNVLWSMKHRCKFLTQGESDIEFVKGSLITLFGLTEYDDTTVFLSKDFLSAYDLELCELTDAFYLRINYKDQPRLETVNVGMYPCDDIVFSLFSAHHAQANKLCIGTTSTGRAGGKCCPGEVWIFRKKRKERQD